MENHTTEELSQLIIAITTNISQLLTKIIRQPTKFINFYKYYFSFYLSLEEFFILLTKHPKQLLDLIENYNQDLHQLLSSYMDIFFSNPMLFYDYKNNEHNFFKLCKEHHSLASFHLQQLLLNLNLDNQILKSKMQFFMQQYLNSIAPDNFIFTNPKIIEKTIADKGINLLRGFNNLLQDLDSEQLSPLLIKQNNPLNFTLGVNLAATPGLVIYKNKLMELIVYQAQTPQVYAIPLLIIPPWINKYYILDLSAHNSFVAWLVKQGITVFMISWVNPDKSYINTTFADYLIQGPLAAIKFIQQKLGVPQINLLGFCIGGTLLTCLLAYLKAKNLDYIVSATFLATMIDFADAGDLGIFINQQHMQKLTEKLRHKGYLSGKQMQGAFNLLRPKELIWHFFINNYLLGNKPQPFDILHWNADSTNMPYKMLSQYLQMMYIENKLIQPHKIAIKNTFLNIADIDIPVFFIATLKDHIAPWKTVYRGFKQLGSNNSHNNKRFILAESGHIAGIVNPPHQNKYGFYYNQNTSSDPDNWLASAQYYHKSWWPKWISWLIEQNSTMIEASTLQPLYQDEIMPAPGEYVLNSTSS